MHPCAARDASPPRMAQHGEGGRPRGVILNPQMKDLAKRRMLRPGATRSASPRRMAGGHSWRLSQPRNPGLALKSQNPVRGVGLALMAIIKTSGAAQYVSFRGRGRRI
jgi:hypothetical protein